MEYFFKARALKQLQNLPRDIQIRIIKKMDFFCGTDDPLSYTEPLIRAELGQYRYRIGDYRVIADLESNGLIILLIGHRKDIYR